jgi:hypothetical protein
MDNAVAPPLDQLQEKQIPNYRVTTVTADQPPDLPVQPNVPELPKELQKIDKVLTTGGTSQDRQDVASHITKVNSETKDYHPNMQPQWGGVVASLLSRNYMGALRYYNGGPIVEESAKDVNGNEYYKSYNMNGDINVVKDKSGKELTAKEKQDLLAKGGLVTKSDRDAMLGINWKNPQANAEMARLGLATTLNTAYVNANNAAQTATSSNNNLEEQIALGKKIPHVLDYISTLDPKNRARILGIVNQYNTVNQQVGTQKENAQGANASQNQQNGATVGIGGNAAIPGGTLGASGNVGASTTAGTNIGANARASEGATSSAGTTVQVQQNLERALLQELQGVIKTPAELKDLLRIQALNASNDEAYKSIPKEAQPPGWELIPETDVLSGGRNAMLINRVSQQKNNALMVEWNKEIYRAQKEAARSGEQVDINDLREKFAKSDIYKAINNTFLNKLDYHLTGEAKRPEKGSLIVDKANKIHVVE